MPIFDTKYNLNAQIFNLCRIFLVTVSLLVLSTLSMANVSMQNHSVANPLLEFDRENIMQNKPSTSDNGLTNAEKNFIEEVTEEVERNNQKIDYRILIKQAPATNNAEFRYQLAETLSELPSNQNLDIRENGRLQTSLNILEELLISNAQFPQIWSRKIIVLKYLAHGHWSYGSALAMTTQPEAKTQFKVSKSYAKKLLSTTKQSVENFPDDEWFAFEREEALEDFSEWADSV